MSIDFVICFIAGLVCNCIVHNYSITGVIRDESVCKGIVVMFANLFFDCRQRKFLFSVLYISWQWFAYHLTFFLGLLLLQNLYSCFRHVAYFRFFVLLCLKLLENDWSIVLKLLSVGWLLIQGFYEVGYIYFNMHQFKGACQWQIVCLYLITLIPWMTLTHRNNYWT